MFFEVLFTDNKMLTFQLTNKLLVILIKLLIFERTKNSYLLLFFCVFGQKSFMKTNLVNIIGNATRVQEERVVHSRVRSDESILEKGTPRLEQR